MYHPLLDDLDLETLMKDEDCGIGGAEEDPAHKTQEDVATREKPGTPGGERDGDRSCHKRSASIITPGVMWALLSSQSWHDCIKPMLKGLPWDALP